MFEVNHTYFAALIFNVPQNIKIFGPAENTLEKK
jgi:hypothetical protein